MMAENLISSINEWLTGHTWEEGTEWPTVAVDPEALLMLMQRLQTDPDYYFDYLFCLTAVDWKTHLTMVYHLTSTRHRHTLVVKAKLPVAAPVIASVSALWKTALFHEREVFELMGVRFEGHPDLRLLILPEGWEGRNPLRKDFEDPINMIRL